MKNPPLTITRSRGLRYSAASLLLATAMFSGSAHAQRLVPPANVGQSPVINVQSTDPALRISELEAQVRALNGKVEELNFLLLKMQEQVRKMQADNELRFQELEDKRSDASTGKKDVAKAKGGDTRLGKPKASGAAQPTDAQTTVASQSSAQSGKAGIQRGLPPRNLGTLTFDRNGNVIAARPADGTGTEGSGKPIETARLPGVFNDGVEGGSEAADFGPTPNAVLKAGLRLLKTNRLDRAEKAFRAHMKAWPKDPQAGAVRFHLGRTLFLKRDYFAAANIHLDTHNEFSSARTAADNLLGLGLSLAGLNQREVACATYAEVLKQYPRAKRRLGKRVAAEQAAARC